MFLEKLAMKKILSILAMTGVSLLAPAAFADSKVDVNLADYKKASGVSGSIISVGSDTLANLMTLWAEEFKRLYPKCECADSGRRFLNCATCADRMAHPILGPMSRKMKDKEIAAFEGKHGYKPTPVAVAIDALAVYVNKDNPLEGMSIAQVDAAFSATRKCGYDQDVTTVGAAGFNWCMGKSAHSVVWP